MREEARKETEREEEARREVERSAKEVTIDETATTLLELSSGNNTNDSSAFEHLTSEVRVQTDLSLKDVKYMEERSCEVKVACENVLTEDFLKSDRDAAKGLTTHYSQVCMHHYTLE